MMRLPPYIAVAGLAVLLLATAGMYALSAFFADPCGNTVVAEVLSPDPRYKAVVFHRDCGATTGFSTQVSVIRALDPLPNESGNVFVADGQHGTTPPTGAGGLEVGAWWKSGTSLVISHPPGARVFKQATEILGVQVAYEPF